MVADPLAIQVMKEFKRALLAYEEAQVARMVKAWMTVDRALARDIEALAEEIARLRSAGEVVTEARLYRLSRYQSLVAQIQAEIARYEQRAAQIIMAGEEDLARMGLNIAADTALGAIPVVGFLFDMGFKANQRNLDLLRQHMREVHR